MKRRLRIQGREPTIVEFFPLPDDTPIEIRVGEETCSARLVERSRDAIRLEVDGEIYTFSIHADDSSRDSLVLVHDHREYDCAILTEGPATGGSAGGPGGPVTLTSQLPGVVRQVLVAAGNPVQRGQAILTLEAMKMENEVVADRDGILEEVLVEIGETVPARAPLARIVPAS